MTTIYFFHGSQSSPLSKKIQHLKPIAEVQGFHVKIPNHSEIHGADERVADMLTRVSLPVGDCMLVGSSMGGYVATVLSEHFKPLGLFLMAPAFYLPNDNKQNPIPHAEKVSIVHGWHDDIVLPENSIRFARKHNATLHLLDAVHNLQSKIDTITNLFRLFLKDG